MELKDFIKTPKGQQFINEYGHVLSKTEIIEEIRKKVSNWLSVGESEQDIKNSAVSYVLRDYEPYTKELRAKTKKLLSKWGIT